MANKTTGPLVDELLLRLRDTGNANIPRAVARRALAYGVGYAAVAYTDTLESFTLTTERRRTLYALSETSERIVRVVRVEMEGRDIPFAIYGIHGLTGRTNWLRDLADRFEAHTSVGRRLFILYPGIDQAVSVTLYCKAFPALVTADSDLVGIIDDFVPFALDIGEALLLVRERRAAHLQTKIKAIEAQLALVTQEAP